MQTKKKEHAHRGMFFFIKTFYAAGVAAFASSGIENSLTAL